MQTELERAIALREQGVYDVAESAFAALYQLYPEHALLNYHYAWLMDTLGRESDAVPFYENAIRLGLPDEDLRGALLGLGSTYRTLGEYEKSATIFQRAREQFPDALEFVVFQAMTLYNLGRSGEAVSDLLHLIADHADSEDVRRFRRAIHLYADDLEKVWS